MEIGNKFQVIAEFPPTPRHFNTKDMENKFKTLIYYYNILVNGKHIETNILGWRTALAHARTHTGDLFGTNKVEILNINTGEIVSYEQAEKFAAKMRQRRSQ